MELARYITTPVFYKGSTNSWFIDCRRAKTSFTIKQRGAGGSAVVCQSGRSPLQGGTGGRVQVDVSILRPTFLEHVNMDTIPFRRWNFICLRICGPKSLFSFLFLFFLCFLLCRRMGGGSTEKPTHLQTFPLWTSSLWQPWHAFWDRRQLSKELIKPFYAYSHRLKRGLYTERS